MSPIALLAEDDGELRELIREMLVEEGFEVEEFSDGSGLLEALVARRDRLGSPPDLLITDVRMPGPSGLQVLARLRRFDPYTPVVVVTAFADRDTEDSVKRLNAALLPKPFDLAELRRAIRRRDGP